MNYRFFDIDFETRSEADIFQVGAYQYAIHPSTQIMIIGYKFDGWEVDDYDPWFCEEEQLTKFIKKVKKLLTKGYKLRAFNSMFELLIWNFVGVRQFGFPELKNHQTYCVQAECCAMGYPASLGNAGKALNLIEQKDTAGTAQINFFSKPSRKQDELFKDPLDHEERFREFKAYCQQDVIVQIAISRHCLKLTDYQYQTFLLTERMNLRGLPMDVPMIEGALKLDEQLKENSDKAINKLTKGIVTTVKQTKVLTEWLNEIGCNIPNMKAETIIRWLEKKDLKKKYRKALILRQEGSRSSTAKYVKAMDYLTPEGRVHDFIKYHIAHTGRWGGRGIQVQNFSKPAKDFRTRYMVTVSEKYCEMNQDKICGLIANAASTRLALGCGSISGALKAVTRGMICAPEGYKLVSADYAQIEARVVMWLANDATGLSDFAGDGRIYENMAASIFDVPSKSIKKPSFQRDVGKETVLGCGFGMGPAKFLVTCVDARGLDIDEKTADKAVKGYRKRYPMVQKSWKSCEKAAVKAMSEPGMLFETCEGMLNYIYENGNLYVILPSGRRLCYPQAIVLDEVDNWGNERQVLYYYTWNMLVPGVKWVKHKTWGGVLFQNAVQAIAADIMNAGMISAEAAGYKSLFTVHDESISLVRDVAKFNFTHYEDLLANHLPAWADGLNIIAEGWEGKRYRK